jgi:hypothetical protein
VRVRGPFGDYGTAVVTSESVGAESVGAESVGAEAPRMPESPARRWSRWAPVSVTTAGMVGLLLITHTPPLDIARYAAYIAWGVLLPGIMLYRVLRRVPHSLVDDCAMGAAVGLAAEIIAYVALSLFGAQGWLIGWPLLVIVPIVATPGLRRRLQGSEGYRRVPLLWSWAIAGIVLYYETYTAFVALRPYPQVPKGARTSYYLQDLQYLLSLVGEYKNRFPGHVPQLADEPLNYHWFSFAHEATASIISGVDTPIAFLRLGQPAIAACAIVLLAVAGWRLSGRPWVGALAAALTFAVGEVVVGTRSLSLFGSSTTAVWTSYSTIYAWVFTFALLIVVADRIASRGDRIAEIGTAAWPLVAVFGIAAAGAKASALPPVIVGIGFAALADLVARRRIAGRLLATGALLVLGYGFVTAVIFRFESHGLSWRPWYAFVEVTDANRGTGLAHYWTAFSIAGVCYVCYQFGRLIGVPVLAVLARRGGPSWGTVEWFLLGGIVAAAGGTLLLNHPSTSQLYFLRSGWGLGAILSAMGYAALVERRRVPARTVAIMVGGCSLVAWVAVGVIWYRAVYHPGSSSAYFPGPASRLVMPVVRRFHLESVVPVISAVGALAAVAALAAIAWFAVRRRLGRSSR